MNPSLSLSIFPESSISELILAYPRLVVFLEHFDVKLPVQALTVHKVCAERKINVELFIAFARIYTGQDAAQEFIPEIQDLPAIITYLRNSHKYYVDEIYPDIQKSIRQIKGANDQDDAEILGRFFQDYFNEVRKHLEYENSIAFPFISALYECFTDKSKSGSAPKYSVKSYQEQHDDIEEKLDDLMNLLIKYLPNENDQKSRRRLFFQLSELDFDLGVHACIEDLVLIPLVEKLEDQLKSEVL